MKVFISQPMKNKTDEEIKADRDRAIEVIKSRFPKNEIKVIDSFFEGAPHDAKPMWYLGMSLQLLSDADAAFFVKRWEDYRGCRIEHLCAVEYGISAIIEE